MATPMLNCCSFQKGMYLPNGVGPTDSCPPIIQTVADILDAVDGTVVGQLTVERYVDGDGNQHVHLYEWDDGQWKSAVETNAFLTAGVYTVVNVPAIEANWQLSTDQGAIWKSGDANVVPPAATVEIWFRNTVNGCIYSNIPQIPLQADYCVEVYEVDVSDPFFFFGTINGIQADDIANVLATYVDWEGNLTSRTFINFATNPMHIVIFRDALTSPFSNLGVYVPFGGGDPVLWTPATSINCTPNCYQAVFTVNDLATDGNSSLTVHGTDVFDIDTGSFTPFNDPAAAANDLAVLIAGNVLEPSATLTYEFNGLEVTITLCTIQEVNSGAWSTDVGAETPFNYTLI